MNEFLGVASFVRRFPNDLDDDVVERRLRVYVGDADFTILEVKLPDTLLDGL